MPFNENGDFVWDEESFERVKEAMEGPFYTVPEGLDREGVRKWLDDVANGKVQPTGDSNDQQR